MANLAKKAYSQPNVQVMELENSDVMTIISGVGEAEGSFQWSSPREGIFNG